MHIIYKLIDSFFFSISGNIFVDCNKERTQQTTRIRRAFRENVSLPTIESHSTMKFSFTLPEKTRDNPFTILNSQEQHPCEFFKILQTDTEIILTDFHHKILYFTAENKHPGLTNPNTQRNVSNMMQNIFIIIICVMLVIVLITNCKRR